MSRSLIGGDEETNPFIKKLELSAALSSADKLEVKRLIGGNPRWMMPDADIVREGDEPTCVNVIVSGWAVRHRTMRNGRKQALGILLPGDMCDLRGFMLARRDHTISSISDVTVATISRNDIIRVTDGVSRLARAFWRTTLIDQAIEREMIVSLGQRSSLQRVCHLFCELFIRLRMIGLAHHDSFDFPFRQERLAELAGISAVHVNRTLQAMRAQDLVMLKDRKLQILDFKRLRDTAVFSDNYLHLADTNARVGSLTADPKATAT